MNIEMVTLYRSLRNNRSYSAGSNDHSYTKYGIYPIGAKYDNGTGGRIATAKEPTGIAPHKIITFATLKFMLAELALAGEITGDAATFLEEAIEASIDHVHSVVDKNASAPNPNPAPKISASRENFLSTQFLPDIMRQCRRKDAIIYDTKVDS